MKFQPNITNNQGIKLASLFCPPTRFCPTFPYGLKVYLIPTNSREFDFPFEMKRGTGEILLSPYASWRFTLVNVTDEADFEEFAQYAEEIDLELVGDGFYLEYKLLDVDKYYKSINENSSICY